MREFVRNLGGPGRVHLVVGPGLVSSIVPSPFTRVWCLWEIFIAQATGSRLQMAGLPLYEVPQARLIQDKDSANDNGDTAVKELLTRLFSSINLEAANATEPADKEAIFAHVRDRSSFDEVNDRVRGAINDSFSWMNDIRIANYAASTGGLAATLLFASLCIFLFWRCYSLAFLFGGAGLDVPGIAYPALLGIGLIVFLYSAFIWGLTFSFSRQLFGDVKEDAAQHDTASRTLSPESQAIVESLVDGVSIAGAAAAAEAREAIEAH